MKKLLLSCIALCSLLGLVGCAVEPTEDVESAELQEVSAAPVEIAAGGKWRLLESRSCFLDFSQPCTSTVPGNQCAGNPVPNTACPTVGVTCNRVIAQTGYQILQCQ